jgi:uncharacterized protein with GYD domain
MTEDSTMNNNTIILSQYANRTGIFLNIDHKSHGKKIAEAPNTFEGYAALVEQAIKLQAEYGFLAVYNYTNHGPRKIVSNIKRASRASAKTVKTGGKGKKAASKPSAEDMIKIMPSCQELTLGAQAQADLRSVRVKPVTTSSSPALAFSNVQRLEEELARAKALAKVVTSNYVSAELAKINARQAELAAMLESVK